MNKKTFTSLLAHPESISQKNLFGLSEIVEKYPFFQTARALHLKSLKKSNSLLYNDALKLTAAYTADRNILFEYITSNFFIQNEISDTIQKQEDSYLKLEVTTEDISEQVSKEIDQQLKTELKKADAILNPDLFHRREKSVEKLTKNEITKSDLEKNNPLDFTKEDSHSFSEWLKLTTAKPIVREETKNLSNSKKPNSDLINKFIQENPKLKPSKSTVKYDNEENLANQITYTSEALMTETLAKVYLQQNNYQKALQAYKILSLKYPEKSGFFADQIRAINKYINKN
ncbi:MAG: hypothetical protein GY823_03385 [Flavobacteriaceae bacterium]|nr:hypothetical protein [Flavobacteriaceae bacterium]|tara:strand:- start:202 stop:1062 length:861 start_codon:yes stop_codon:yes gene_type:complete